MVWSTAFNSLPPQSCKHPSATIFKSLFNLKVTLVDYIWKLVLTVVPRRLGMALNFNYHCHFFSFINQDTQTLQIKSILS